MPQRSLKTVQRENIQGSAAPVLKWAGGKSQLLDAIDENYPQELGLGQITTYIEPFVGSGAVFFDLMNRFKFKRAYLFDVNPDLIILYNSLKKDVDSLVTELRMLETSHLAKSEEGRKEHFYFVRENYNQGVADAHERIPTCSINAKRAAMTIFLNRTCFNGLFRVNSRSQFNVPFGRYKNPTILFEGKLRSASAALQNVEIQLEDFSKAEEFADNRTFVYYDPPYRPISQTSSFTSYSKDTFNDDEQRRLATLYRELDSKGVKQLSSNSDPTNYADDDFFDELYKGFRIVRVAARRAINSAPEKRGDIRELLIRNY